MKDDDYDRMERGVAERYFSRDLRKKEPEIVPDPIIRPLHRYPSKSAGIIAVVARTCTIM